VYLYGEGWNFGEVANNARGVQASQLNMAGTGIGTFSDRLRDGARGGGPFSGLQEQGFLTGLGYDPNVTPQGSPADQLARLLLAADWIRVGLAGNLADYELVDRFGNLVQASEIDYNGQPAGYTADPQEVINYVEAHDNETLFDAIQLKAPVPTPMAERVRMQNLGMSLLAFGQGVPFFHAGVELLRSKSLDRNSYNSGDWFNRLDFSGQDDNWGVGLPPARDNQSSWPIHGPLLADPALDPQPGDIGQALEHFREVLAIRRSSPLFRLRTGEDVRERVRFHNTGPGQIPGLIVMTVSDAEGEVDRRREQIVVAFNADDDPRDFTLPLSPCPALALHPLQAASHDSVVRAAAFAPATCGLELPARTAAVFVAWRPVEAQLELLLDDVGALASAGALNRGQGNALRVKLEHALARFRAGHLQAALGSLGAFIHQVEAFVRAGILTPEQAEPLLAAARGAAEAMVG
jgi:pullulanase-type alpha-1,6-glucosidase